MSEGITSYIDDLFKYIDDYEKSYSSFEVEAFFQTYNGICAVFQALRQQREKAVEVDRVFLEKIKRGPLNSSDLRQLTIQVLISFFESIADTDGQSNRAYLYCREFRNVKRDVPYFEDSLIPLLMRDGSLYNNFRLNSFFLKEIGRFITNFSSGWNIEPTFEDFKGFSDPMKLLTLYIRRLKLGTDLAKDRNSLEFHMQSVGGLAKLRQSGDLYEQYLLEWGYLSDESFFDRVKKSLIVLWSNFKGLCSNFNYLRLALAQRYSAYLFYSVVIIIFLLLAIIVPGRWNRFTEKKLAEFENRVDQTEEAIGK
ncbi:MAG: hypothetical protein JW746_01460 [Candidatus Krumholzibacteriota bacterium]|nr:hypothetical protein [Candidatus Krumholzibacteriota bacterium]